MGEREEEKIQIRGVIVIYNALLTKQGDRLSLPQWEISG